MSAARGGGTVTLLFTDIEGSTRLPALDESPAVTVELQGLAMSLARAGRAADAVEVDRIASSYAEHFNMPERAAFWEALREQNLGLARASLPTYVPSHPLDDLAAARDWALGLADEARPYDVGRC